MKINLKVDYEGKPYLELLSDNETATESQFLEYFIREALKKGIFIKNEADSDIRNDYASIRIKQP